MLMYFTKNYKYIYIYILLQFSWLIFCLLFFNNMRFVFLPFVSKNGHLAWNWTNNNTYEVIFGIIYLLFYLFTIYIYTNPIIFNIGVMTLIYSLYNYWKFNTVSTMWCWFANLIISVYLIIAIYKFDMKTNKFIRYINKK
jgi:hypothetical protein